MTVPKSRNDSIPQELVMHVGNDTDYHVLNEVGAAVFAILDKAKNDKGS